MRRELGGFESAEAWTGESYAYNAVMVVRLEGRLSEELLVPALAEVQRRHPLLRARLVREGRRWYFEESPGEIPLRRVDREGEETWCAEAEEELNRRMEPAVAPLVRCCLIASSGQDGPCELVIGLHHAIADARSAANICRQVLSLCGDGGAAGEAKAPGEPSTPGADTAGELPPAPDSLFPTPFRGLSLVPALAGFMVRRTAEEVSYLWRSRSLRSVAPAASARCRVLSVQLGEAATRGLVRRCRRERVPLNSALNAALLLAVQQHRYDGRSVPLRYFAFADLRPYLEPPPSPETVASYLTTMRLTLGVEAGEPFWRLSRRVSEQLLESFRRGEKYLFCLTAAPLLRTIIRIGRMRFGSAAVSYTGPLDFPESFGELRVGGLHAFVSNMPIGAEVTAQARLFRGRLWWDFVTLDADMDEVGARTIAADILGRLEEAAHERD